MIEDVTKIVQRDNPVVAMRKRLIEEIHSNSLNRSFLLEKYVDRRQELYDALNQFMGETENGNTDETASIVFVWSEAECYILRVLQMHYFEKIGKDDWFSRYCESYETYIHNIFDLELAKNDKEDTSIYSVLFPALKQAIETCQKNLIGEIVE